MTVLVGFGVDFLGKRETLLQTWGKWLRWDFKFFSRMMVRFVTHFVQGVGNHPQCLGKQAECKKWFA